jgi:hypothetical protein
MDQPTEPAPPAAAIEPEGLGSGFAARAIASHHATLGGSRRATLAVNAPDAGGRLPGEDRVSSENPAPGFGRLRRGDLSGNPQTSRCGPRNRAADPSRTPVMINCRCRGHGGKSTGPRTHESLQRLRAARTLRGFYGEEGRAFRHTIAALFAQGRWLRLLAEMRGTPLLQNTNTLPSRTRDGVRPGN